MGRMLSTRALPPSPAGSAPPPLRGKQSGRPRLPQFGPLATGPATPSAIQAEEEPEPAMKMAFNCALGMLFVRMSILPEVLARLTHVDTYLLYLITPPVAFGLAVTGGFPRAMRSIPILAWCAMFVCMLVSVPFSIWVGASAGKVLSYGRTELLALFVLAGTVVNWGQIRRVCGMMAYSGVFVLMIAFFWATPGNDGRLGLELGGTIGNPNDLAAHVVLLLPFILLYATEPKRAALLRYPMLASVPYGVWVIIGTGSRGCLIAVGLMTLIIFFCGSSSLKVVLGLAVPAVIAVVLTLAPGRVLERLATLFVSDAASEVAVEAGESMASRSYLLQQSIKFTLENPMFGVGPGQFSLSEGMLMRSLGKTGNWHETHNSYTQVSSECGLPALIFMLTGIFGGIAATVRTFQLAQRNRADDIARVAMYATCAMVGYFVSITFLPSAYRFTLPAMVGFAVALRNTATRTLSLRNPRAPLA